MDLFDKEIYGASEFNTSEWLDRIRHEKPKEKQMNPGDSTVHILLVDDNQNNLFTLRTLIHEHVEAKITEADSGLAALRAVMQHDIDLIILDVQMPEMDGFEAARMIRQRKKTQNVPIVFLTAAYKSEEFRQQGLKIGASDYLTKPIEPVQLMNRIQVYIRFIEQERRHNKELEKKVQERTRQLKEANNQVSLLNKRLQSENLRLGSELNIARRIQETALPKAHELKAIPGLDIAAYMNPAEKVGGDYYDVLHHKGKIKIAIGDVTGHGLESGILALMVQMAVRTLVTNGVDDPVTFLNLLNKAVFNNLQRMEWDKNLSLCLLEYEQGNVRICGQHEDVLVVRGDGTVEQIDTTNLGFMIGIMPDVSGITTVTEVNLAPGDGLVLYTDGIPEAFNHEEELYGLERLSCMVKQHWKNSSADGVQKALLDDLQNHTQGKEQMDDITLLVLKRVS